LIHVAIRLMSIAAGIVVLGGGGWTGTHLDGSTALFIAATTARCDRVRLPVRATLAIAGRTSFRDRAARSARGDRASRIAL
jgi:hypothetical protein